MENIHIVISDQTVLLPYMCDAALKILMYDLMTFADIRLVLIPNKGRF